MRVATVAAFIGALMLAALPAEAAFIETAMETNSGVTITGTGSINLDGLTSAGPISLGNSAVIAASGNLFFSGQTDGYIGITGPSSFGAGQIMAASAQTGDSFALFAKPGILAVPAGYVSGAPLSNNLTFAGATFESLGLTVGSYVYRFGESGNADFVIFQVDAAPSVVAEPATLLILGFSLTSLIALRRQSGSTSVITTCDEDPLRTNPFIGLGGLVAV